MLYITYDEQGDVLYVQFRERSGSGASKDFGGDRFVEYDSDGPLGVEFLFASQGVNLDGIPQAEDIKRGLKTLAGLLGPGVRARA